MFGFKEVGVDLGTDSIKFSIATKIKGLRNVVNKVESYKVYKNTEKKYSKEYFRFLKACLADFVKENKIKTVSLNIVLSVDSSDVKLNFIDVPFINKKTFNASMKYEILSEYGNENSVSSWKIVADNKEEKEEVRVLIASVNKKIVDSLAQFKTITTRVNRVVVQPVVLAEEVTKTEAIIDLSHSSTRVNLYLEGQLAQVETINFGGFNIIKAIEKFIEEKELPYSSQELINEVKVYNPAINLMEIDLHLEDLDKIEPIPEEEDSWYSNFNYDTEEEVELFGEDSATSSSLGEEHSEDQENLEVFSEDSDLIFDDEESSSEVAELTVLQQLSLEIDDEINSMIDDVKKVVRMFELENSTSLSMIRCTGEFSEMTFLKEKLNSELELDVIPLDVIDIKDERMKSVVTLAALGSASYSNKKDVLDFSKEIKANIDFTSILAMTLALTITAGAGAKFAGESYHEKLNEVQSVVQVQNETLNKVNLETEELRMELDNYERFINRLEELDAQKFWLSDGLYAIPGITPLTISVKDIQIENGEMILHGYSGDYSSIGLFAKKMEELGNVEIESITKLDDKNIYTVTMEDPSLISDIYSAKHYFKIKMTYNNELLSH